MSEDDTLAETLKPLWPIIKIMLPTAFLSHPREQPALQTPLSLWGRWPGEAAVTPGRRRKAGRKTVTITRTAHITLEYARCQAVTRLSVSFHSICTNPITIPTLQMRKLSHKHISRKGAIQKQIVCLPSLSSYWSHHLWGGETHCPRGIPDRLPYNGRLVQRNEKHGL